jgi:hypothetical protein
MLLHIIYNFFASPRNRIYFPSFLALLFWGGRRRGAKLIFHRAEQESGGMKRENGFLSRQII